jgi:hypothetical protein
MDIPNVPTLSSFVLQKLVSFMLRNSILQRLEPRTFIKIQK